MQAYLRLNYPGGRRFATIAGTDWGDPSGGVMIWARQTALAWTDVNAPSEPLSTVEWRHTTTSEGNSVSVFDTIEPGTEIVLADMGLAQQPKVEKFSIGFPAALGNVKLDMNARNFMAECIARPRFQDRTLRLTAATSTVDAYDGPPPGSADDAAAGTKLWTHSGTPGVPIYLAASAGAANLNGGRSGIVLASGAPSYARLTIVGTSGFFIVIQGSAGAVGSGTDFQFDASPFVQDDVRTLNAAQMRFV